MVNNMFVFVLSFQHRSICQEAASWRVLITNVLMSSKQCYHIAALGASCSDIVIAPSAALL